MPAKHGGEKAKNLQKGRGADNGMYEGAFDTSLCVKNIITVQEALDRES